MFSRKLLPIVIMVMSFFACGVLPEQNTFETFSNTVELGVLGNKKKSIYKTNFEVSSIPYYKKFIKVSVTEKSFTKKIYKEYQKVIKETGVSEEFKYVDSLKIKPKFMDLIIEDKALVIESLNDLDNTNVKNYTRNMPKTKIVSGLRVVFQNNVKEDFKKADALYFRTDQQKKQTIYLFKNGKQIAVLDTSKAFIFGVKLSSFCWGGIDAEKIGFVSLVSDGENCTIQSNRDPKKLEKKHKKNYFNY
ncbi:hypothetical protein [Tenacibaculum sp. C7A-26P2]|uniref:hypothetical protein n=1 Tax=Tenacibaculum sp. C7A-26P2 TaxID=3447504 RepID=UPI003F849F3B